MSDSERRVLSIQSHVVFGYVGNKAAVLPLQALGFDVDFINSVQFSNHTGYPLFDGSVLESDDLKKLLDALDHNKLTRFYTHVLSGYIASKEVLIQLARFVQRLKASNPNLIYVCDPVLGDVGKWYVPPELADVYREHLLPLADVVTPNQFEAETLAQKKISSEADALAVIAAFHARGVRTVILSSLDADPLAQMPGSDKAGVSLVGYISSLISAQKAANGARSQVVVRYRAPRLRGYFTGTGDLFTALVLAHLELSGGGDDADASAGERLVRVARRVLCSVQAVLRDTAAHAASVHVAAEIEQQQNEKQSDAPIAGLDDRLVIADSARYELRIVQSLAHIIHPPVERAFEYAPHVELIIPAAPAH